MTEPDNIFIASSAYLRMALDRLSREFPEDVFTFITTEEFPSRLGDFVRRFRRYRRAVFYTYDFQTSRTILWHGIVWWLARQGVPLHGTGENHAAAPVHLLLLDAPPLLIEQL